MRSVSMNMLARFSSTMTGPGPYFWPLIVCSSWRFNLTFGSGLRCSTFGPFPDFGTDMDGGRGKSVEATLGTRTRLGLGSGRLAVPYLRGPLPGISCHFLIGCEGGWGLPVPIYVLAYGRPAENALPDSNRWKKALSRIQVFHMTFEPIFRP